jgi:hypothetical protein
VQRFSRDGVRSPLYQTWYQHCTAALRCHFVLHPHLGREREPVSEGGAHTEDGAIPGQPHSGSFWLRDDGLHGCNGQQGKKASGAWDDMQQDVVG